MFSNFLFHCHILGLKLFYTLSFQTFLFAVYISLLGSSFFYAYVKVLFVVVFFSLNFSSLGKFLFLKKFCSIKYV